MSRLPNFLVIGGVRCGTTSLRRYLKQHPDVFMCEPKEPAFFLYGWEGGEVPRFAQQTVCGLDAYRGLFADRSEAALGEASVIYLYRSSLTAPRIAEVLDGPRLVVLLRHPAERAFSQYRMAVRTGAETLTTFREGLDAEDRRVAEGANEIVHYRRQSRYADHLEDFIRRFGRERMAVHLFDDFVTNTTDVVRRLFAFLGVAPDFPVDARKIDNATSSKLMRRTWRQRLFRRKIARARLPSPEEQARLARAESAPPADLMASLTASFEDDVLRTAALLDRDLSHWLG